MAPGVTAHCLSAPVPVLSTFIVKYIVLTLVSLLVINVQSLLVYDHHALLYIFNSAVQSLHANYEQTSNLPLFLLTVPNELQRCEPAFLPQKRTCRRRPRDKNSSMHLKMRTLLKMIDRGCETSF